MSPAKTMPHYVPGLDGIRAICITFVVLGHIGFGDIIPGGLGVTTFFFISGYLITGLLADEHAKFGRIDLPRFYGRRALRLLPELAVFVAVLALVIGPIAHQPLPLGAMSAALLYWTNYYVVWGFDTCTNCSVTGHLWSLAVEEHFYLIMPLAMAACAFAPKRLAWLLVAVMVACPGWRMYVDGVLHWREIYTYKTTECRLDSIAWGCFASVIQRSRPDLMAWIRRNGVAVFAAGLMLVLFTLIFRNSFFRDTWRYTLQSLAMIGLVLPLVEGAPKLQWIVGVLEWKPLKWMGRRSYGAYVWHYTAMTFAAFLLGVHGELEFSSLHNRLLAIPPTIAVDWLLAALSYTLVFKPPQRFKALLQPRERTAPAGMPLAAE